jgi:hypothetical protein
MLCIRQYRCNDGKHGCSPASAAEVSLRDEESNDVSGEIRYDIEPDTSHYDNEGNIINRVDPDRFT